MRITPAIFNEYDMHTVSVKNIFGRKASKNSSSTVNTNKQKDTMMWEAASNGSTSHDYLGDSGCSSSSDRGLPSPSSDTINVFMPSVPSSPCRATNTVSPALPSPLVKSYQVPSTDFKTQIQGKLVLSAFDAEKIVSGGQATVFKARDPSSGESIAMKVTSLHNEANRVNSRREVVVYERLHDCQERHPNLLYANKIMEGSDHTAVSMPRMPADLVTVLKDADLDVSANAVNRMILKLCEAALHLHSLNVCHRDIKPENILLSTTNIETAEPILCDYGLCGLTDSSKYLGSQCGSRRYSPPEVWNGPKGSKYDSFKVDVFSIALVMFATVTRFCPWERSSMEDPAFKMWVKRPEQFFKWANKHAKTPLTTEQCAFFRVAAHPDAEKRCTMEEARHFMRSVVHGCAR